MTRPPLRLLIAAVATATTVLAVTAATAWAGSYTVSACSPSSSGGAWQPVNPYPGSLTVADACGTGTPAIGPNPVLGFTETGALYSEDTLNNTSVPDGATAGWQFSAPAGTTITSVSYYAAWETDGGGWMSGMLVDGAPSANVCETNLNQTSPCPEPSGPAQASQSQTEQTLSGLSAQTLLFGIGCRQVQGSPICNTNIAAPHEVEADLYSAAVTLTETNGPAVSSASGGLWSAGSVVSGSVPLSFAASDASGISSVRVLGPSGQVLASQSEACNYGQAVPCPQLPAGQITVNTALLADGSPNVQLQVLDAAGNATTLTGPGIVVDNNGPPAPTNFAASASGDTIHLIWANPATAPQPITGGYAQLCPSTGSCASAVAVSDSGAAQLTAPGPGSYIVHLWLVDAAGKGSAANATSTTVTVASGASQPPPCCSPPNPSPACCKTGQKSTKKDPCKGACPVFKIASHSYKSGKLHLTITGLPGGDHLKLTISRHEREHGHQVAAKRFVTTKTVHYRKHTARRQRLTIKTGRPFKVYLQAFRGKHRVGGHRIITKFR